MLPLRRLSLTPLRAGIVPRIFLPGGIGLPGRRLAQNSNYSTNEEKQALVKREQEKRKTKVHDPDFISGGATS